MIGPEAVPYGSIGTYADALSTRYNLSAWQTKHLLIDEIPKEDLPTVDQSIYDQTSGLADVSEDPNYYGALQSVAWADKLDTGHRRYSTLTGAIGAGTGGAIAVAAESVYVYNRASSAAETAATQPTPTEQNIGLIESAWYAGMLIAPVVIIGVIGTYMGKKLSPNLRKAVARRIAKRIHRADADPEQSAPDFVELPDLDSATLRVARKTSFPTGSHLESVTEALLYPTARRWANNSGCFDKQQYAKFITAEMPPDELTKMVVQTKRLHQDFLAGRVKLSSDDPRYIHLLHNMRMVRDITQLRAETRAASTKAYRGIGYIGILSYAAFQIASEETTDTSNSELTYAAVLQALAGMAALTGAVGSCAADLLSRKTDTLTRWRAKRLAAQTVKKDSQDTTGLGE